MECFACAHPLVPGAEFCSRCGARRLTPAADPLIGTVVGGRYRIARLLGEGGMGVVYAAEQQMGTTIRQVAVKVLLPELSRDATLRRRFLAECSIVARLEHPHTVDVYDFGETPEGQLYVVMELVRGESLGNLTGALPPWRVWHIIEQVSGALHEAHELGIVHRDLKPDNVLLTCRAGEEDFVKLLDFGIALHTQASGKTRLTAAGTVLGTPPYMSPEQLAGIELDRRSDVYSLGIITYELLTGRLPFAARTPWEWAQRHRCDVPLSFTMTAAGRAVPEPVRAVVLAALAKQPEQRPATARLFASRLGEALRDSVPRTTPVAVVSPPPAIEPARPERTQRAMAAPIPAVADREPSNWLGIAVAIPTAALGFSLLAVAGAWHFAQPAPLPDARSTVAAPSLTVLHADLPEPVASASSQPAASGSAGGGAAAPSLPTATSARPSTSATASSPLPPPPRSPANATGRRPPRPRR